MERAAVERELPPVSLDIGIQLTSGLEIDDRHPSLVFEDEIDSAFDELAARSLKDDRQLAIAASVRIGGADAIE